MNPKASALAAIMVLGAIPLLCQAQEFSADVVYGAAGKSSAPAGAAAGSAHETSRLYVSKDQLRLETRGLTGTILLVNAAEHTAFALFPDQKAYQPLTNGPSEYFRTDNADNACADWQQASAQKIVCEKVGPELVAGRRTVKYQNKLASDAATAAVWIDVALKYVVKWQGARSGAELHDIKEAPQSATLFAVPEVYQILRPQQGKSKGFTQKRPK